VFIYQFRSAALTLRRGYIVYTFKKWEQVGIGYCPNLVIIVGAITMMSIRCSRVESVCQLASFASTLEWRGPCNRLVGSIDVVVSSYTFIVPISPSGISVGWHYSLRASSSAEYVVNNNGWCINHAIIKLALVYSEARCHRVVVVVE
jgi:hypothetical protein